jgi:hypothetical protein
MQSLIVKGQGVFIFPIFPCSFQLLNKNQDDGLGLKVENNKIKIIRLNDNSEIITNESEYDGGGFYFSLNAQNQSMCFGFGEARIETVLATHQFDHSMKPFLENIELIQTEYKVRIVKDPIKRAIPLFIKDKDSLSMKDIATDKYMTVASLSPICQQLYNSISGKNFVLNTKDFPDFSKAIDYSINTPGLWCNKKLIEKSQEFGKSNIDETYLRITLGSNNGESPGIPYVMEIWPSGHYSPIHSHSSANAIIRVLRGEIDVHLYAHLKSKKEFGSQKFKKGDVTWIFPTLNQTHQLKNDKNNKKCCVTIQCYMYDKKDKAHYDYFDYIDSSGNVQQYEPDSDKDFNDFKELIRKEWKNKKSFIW